MLRSECWVDHVFLCCWSNTVTHLRRADKQFWKNGRLLPQTWSSLDHPKKNNPATLCPASPIRGCAQRPFLCKILSVGKCGRLQHDHPGILQELPEPRESRLVHEPESLSQHLKALLLFQIFLPPNSVHSGGIQLVSQPAPGLFTIASANSSHRPSLLVASTTLSDF